MSAEELSRLKVQLSKAKASSEASRKQVEQMQEKMLDAERAKRAEEVAFREKKGQIERELKDFKKNYGPEKVNELTKQVNDHPPCTHSRFASGPPSYPLLSATWRAREF